MTPPHPQGGQGGIHCGKEVHSNFLLEMYSEKSDVTMVKESPVLLLLKDFLGEDGQDLSAITTRFIGGRTVALTGGALSSENIGVAARTAVSLSCLRFMVVGLSIFLLFSI